MDHLALPLGSNKSKNIFFCEIKMTKKYYFPPVGFGVWYQFGVLSVMTDTIPHKIYGSSGGSVVCFVSLLKKEDRDFDSIMRMYQNACKSHWWNLYQCLNQFLEQIEVIIHSYDEEYINTKLKNIKIEVTEWKWGGFRGHLIQPKSVQELHHLVLASSFVPFLFWRPCPLFYEWQNKWYFDGFFANWSEVDSSFQKINSYQYGTLIPCDENTSLLLYEKGKQYNFSAPNEPFRLLVFFQMTWNIIRDFLKATLRYRLLWNMKHRK